MSENKVYTPETIAENPFPGEVAGASFDSSQSGTKAQTSGEKTNNQSFPEKRIAVELISAALNTKSKKILQSFQLAQSGGFQIGNFEEGESGQVDITPNGIVARDLQGVLSFVLDALTGDATFRGIIQAGTLIGGKVIVGQNNVIIDGENQRIIVNDGTNDRIIIGYDPDGF